MSVIFRVKPFVKPNRARMVLPVHSYYDINTLMKRGLKRKVSVIEYAQSMFGNLPWTI